MRACVRAYVRACVHTRVCARWASAMMVHRVLNQYCRSLLGVCMARLHKRQPQAFADAYTSTQEHKHAHTCICACICACLCSCARAYVRYACACRMRLHRRRRRRTALVTKRKLRMAWCVCAYLFACACVRMHVCMHTYMHVQVRAELADKLNVLESGIQHSIRLCFCTRWPTCMPMRVRVHMRANVHLFAQASRRQHLRRHCCPCNSAALYRRVGGGGQINRNPKDCVRLRTTE